MVFIELQLCLNKRVEYSLLKMKKTCFVGATFKFISGPTTGREGSYELPVCIREAGGKVDPKEPIDVATRLPRRPMAALMVSYDVTPSMYS
jgi:hypothetical protein